MNNIMHQEQDKAFLSLLSSQRQLLSQLNKENEVQKSIGQQLVLGGAKKNHSDVAGLYHHPYQQHHQYHHHHQETHDILLGELPMRRPSTTTLAETRPKEPFSAPEDCYDMLPNRWHASSWGDDDDEESMLLPFSFQELSQDSLWYSAGKTQSLQDSCSHSPHFPELRNKKRPAACYEEARDEEQWTSKKRRLSNLGLGSAFLEADRKYPQAPARKKKTMNDKRDTGSSDEDEDASSSSFSSSSSSCGVSLNPIRFDSKTPVVIDAAQLKQAMQHFTSAMEKSQKSQQDIHQWDREMGLKRSHSKTMRLSTRSRKRLSEILKRQFIAKAG